MKLGGSHSFHVVRKAALACSTKTTDREKGSHKLTAGTQLSRLLKNKSNNADQEVK